MSNLSNLFRSLHSPVVLSHLLSFDYLLGHPDFAKEIKAPKFTRDEAETAANYIGCSLEDLYVSSSGFYPFFYYKDYVFQDITSLDISVLSFMQLPKRIKAQESAIRDYIEGGEYEKVFYIADKKVLFSVFMDLFEEIPDDQVYPIFREIYVRSDYGFSNLDADFVSNILTYYVPEDYKKKTQDSLKPFTESGHIRIYRGEADQSTPYEQAYSWTLSIDTAEMFATRHGSKGKIYSTIVPVENVVDYITSRGESEILILPEDICSDDVEDVTDEVPGSVILSLSPHMQSIFSSQASKITPDLFKSPRSVHGVDHCTRVLLHACYLSDQLSLGPSDIRILTIAAVYHDIGRIDDSEDEDHGYRSWEKLKHLKLYTPDSKEEENTVKFIIENHCIADLDGASNLSEYAIADKERALYLYKIFKDADGLDRVRLGDLDIDYLRTPVAKTCHHFANRVLKEIGEGL